MRGYWSNGVTTVMFLPLGDLHAQSVIAKLTGHRETHSGNIVIIKDLAFLRGKERRQRGRNH